MKFVVAAVQILLALHTGIGAIWKLMNPAALTPMFPMLPQASFVVVSLVELGAAALLLLPFAIKSLRGYGWIGAIIVTAEMLIFTSLYLSTGTANYSPIYYWLVVAAVGAFIAYVRCKNKFAAQTA
jgi:hypothetical protein